ncbi:hypothetical protein [Natronorubrum tibetense]|nr:hypothetical protein [Natronorubrum tibetense]
MTTRTESPTSDDRRRNNHGTDGIGEGDGNDTADSDADDTDTYE